MNLACPWVSSVSPFASEQSKCFFQIDCLDLPQNCNLWELTPDANCEWTEVLLCVWLGWRGVPWKLENAEQSLDKGGSPEYSSQWEPLDALIFCSPLPPCSRGKAANDDREFVRAVHNFRKGKRPHLYLNLEKWHLGLGTCYLTTCEGKISWLHTLFLRPKYEFGIFPTCHSREVATADGKPPACSNRPCKLNHHSPETCTASHSSAE